MRGRKNPVLVAIEEAANVRRRISLENAHSTRALLVHRDDVVGEGHACGRILQHYGLAVPHIGRIQEFAEIAGPHLDGRYRERRKIGGPLTNPFLTPIPEHLIAGVVELAGDVERSADVVAELIVVDWRHEILADRVVARPGVGVECIVTNVIVSRAVELAAAAPGQNANLAARRAAEFHRVGSGENLDFRGRVHIGRADAGTVGAGTHRGSAVISDQALRRARSVDVAGALAHTERVAGQVSAACARNQIGHEDRVASVQFEAVDLFPGHVLRDGSGFRLQGGSNSRDFHGFRSCADRERDIRAQRTASVQFVAGAFILLKAGDFHSNRVVSRGNVGDCVVAGIVGCG